jgi:molybdenum cofactor cytidylyltransferase
MGQQKLLLPWKGGTMISHVVDQVTRAAVRRIVIVVGTDDRGVRAALAGRPVEFVINPDDDGPMLSSVRRGLTALSDVDAALIVLGDQPAISERWVNAIIDRSDGQSIVVPVFRGKRGHPILIPRRFFPDVHDRFETQGLRGLLAAYPQDVTQWQSTEQAVLTDLDTPDDYARAAAAAAGCADAGGSVKTTDTGHAR